MILMRNRKHILLMSTLSILLAAVASITFPMYSQIKPPASITPIQFYENGICGWPREMIDATDVFPWKDSNVPLIAIIDTGVDTSNIFLPVNKIHQIILDQSSIESSKIHGTMVAGLIVANGNGWSTPEGAIPNADLLSIQVGTENGATLHQLAEGIVLAVNYGARVINISLGTPTTSKELTSAVEYAFSKGVIIVAAAGNQGHIYNDYPAAYNGVIAVSGFTQDEKLDHNSNYDSSHNIGAPGDYLLTTSASNLSDDCKQWFSGSSAAAPFVTSLCAILISKHKSLSYKDVYNIIFRSSRHSNVDGATIRILDAQSALKVANTMDSHGQH